MAATYTPLKMHVGFADVWIGGTAPTSGTPVTITSGSPSNGGTNIGTTESELKFAYKPKYEYLGVEQALTEVDAATVGEELELDFTLAELTSAQLKLILMQASLTTNSGSTPTTNMMTLGGKTSIAPVVVTFISQKRNNAGNYYISTFYRCIGSEMLDLAFGKTKRTAVACKFRCLADITRPANDQLSQFVEQSF